jgi:hypothetical protein
VQVWLDIDDESLKQLQTRPAVFVGNHQTCVNFSGVGVKS